MMSEVLLEIRVKKYSDGHIEAYMDGSRLTEEPLRSMILSKAGTAGRG